MFKVKNWNTNETISEHTKLSSARRACKKLGHDGTNNGAYWAPVAYVEDENGWLVYNPRFKM